MADLVEAFPGRFPSEILGELRRLPAGFLEEVIEARAYRSIKSVVEAADSKEARERLPTSRLYRLVEEIETDLILEWKAKHSQ